MSEYIGSKISLISKSDIKYEGTLFEINSEQSTVSLENVTSFGTQGRRGNPAEEIQGSDQVYEFIVFRGSDVKELQIVAPRGGAKENDAPPRMPDDPAILGSARPHNQQPHQPSSQLPPQQQQQRQQPPPHQPPFNPAQGQFSQPPPPQFGGYQGPPPPNAYPNPSRFQGPGGPHGFPGMPGAVPGYGMGFPPPPPPGYYGPPPGQGFPHQPPPPNGPPHQQMAFPQSGQQFDAQPGPHQPPSGGSKQSTPQPTSTNAPPPPPQTTPPAPRQIDTKVATDAKATAMQKIRTPAPTTAAPADVSSTSTAPLATSQPPTAPKAWSKNNNRVAIPLQPANRGAKPTAQPSDGAAPSTIPAPASQPQSIADATQAATAAVAAAMAKLGTGNQGQAQSQGDNLTQKLNQMRIQDPQRGRGRSRGAASRGARRESGPKQIDVPKEDFDFESSNAKFNKESLVKEAIATGSPIASPVNGQSADIDTTASSNLNGDHEEDVVIPAAEKGYDKTSSFFDNISSDLKDRIEQAERTSNFVDGRAMRREERNKNVETFGQGSVDSGGYRGGFRGRGRGGRVFGYPPRGGPGYRGGNRGGYEGRGGGYRSGGTRGAESTLA